jgi:methyl-accepting chemotaxis protein
LIGVVLNRQITDPLNHVSKVAQQVASGDLTQLLKGTQNQTEVGQLYLHFKT